MQRTPAPYFMNGQSERPWKRFISESLSEGFKIPKFSKYNGVSDPYHHLLSFCGDCRGLDSHLGYFSTFELMLWKGKHSSRTHFSPLMLYIVFDDVINRFTSQ
ncbi:hypothetical protein Salat_2358700 [Sesamum alatum]|uniref:Uncharacterized protein n=1 Tax=Sesamum alatum TaxID=300844 RepID=A0AAE1XXT5_9LAMI|nr:hypothetical protein Salat_2358700 [Sesamum alatum]